LALAVVVAGAPASVSAQNEPLDLAGSAAAILQGTSLRSVADERSFEMESMSFFHVSFDLATVSRDLRSVLLEGIVRTVVRGDPDGQSVTCDSYMAGTFEAISTLWGPMTGSASTVDACAVSPFHDGPPSSPSGGRFRFNQSLALRIGARSTVFATWSTVGFFQVEVTPDPLPQMRHRMFAIVDRSLILGGRIVDPAGDTPWADLSFPTWTDSSGRRFKPLFASYVADLDGRINLNVHGNVRASGAATIDLHSGLKHPIILMSDREPPKPDAFLTGVYRDLLGRQTLDGTAGASWQSTLDFGSVLIQGTAGY
jgi:hypothetical protein